jgi:hypothetical protein
MTMVTRTIAPSWRPSEGGDAVKAGTPDRHGATVKIFCRCALAALTAGAMLAAIIAIDAAFYLRSFNG